MSNLNVDKISTYVQGTLTTDGQTLEIDTVGFSALEVQIGTGTDAPLGGIDQIVFEATIDEVSWFSIQGCDLYFLDGQIPSETDHQSRFSFNVGGVTKFRLRCVGTGSQAVSMRTSNSSSVINQILATTFTSTTVTSSVLPDGAATAALQTQPGVDIGDVTVNNAAGAAAVNIQDGGNSITIDGSLTNISGTISLPTGASTSALQTTGNASLASIDSKITLNYGVATAAIRTASQIGNTTGQADFNFGTVGAQTLRVAAQIGNATGAADFNSGATGAQTLRTVANQGTSPWVISGTVTSSNFPTTLDTNYGTVGASTLRTAAQIGNATGAADFNAGATGAQTLRVVANQGAPNTAANGWFTKITDGTDTALVTAAGEQNVLATAQPGVDIGDVTINNAAGASAVNIQDGGNSITVDGTVSASNFPTTVDTNYGTVGANTIRTAAQIGNATGAALFGAGTTTAQVLRVVLPTDQTVIPVQGQKTNNNAAPDATNVGVLPAIATAAIQTWTEGNQVALSTDLGGRARVLNTPTLGILQTYSASASNVLSVASATDIFTITGSATKTIVVTLLTVSGTATSATVAALDIVIRSTANSAGTSSNLVEVPNDSANAAATATTLSYTANPTLGTTVGTIRSFKCFLPPPSGGNANTPSYPVLFPHTFSQGITLRGTGQVLAINLKGVTITGGSFNCVVEWVEF